ncbi:MAG: ARC6/PARC6 family protein, partial [Microcystaceae cyanobacterium]
LKGSNHYWQYQHQVQIRSVKNLNANQAIVEVDVREIASYYQNGKLNPSRSYNDNLRVRYELVRQQERWLIQGIKVI